jgi:hypothetical protein
MRGYEEKSQCKCHEGACRKEQAGQMVKVMGGTNIKKDKYDKGR